MYCLFKKKNEGSESNGAWEAETEGWVNVGLSYKP